MSQIYTYAVLANTQKRDYSLPGSIDQAPTTPSYMPAGSHTATALTTPNVSIKADPNAVVDMTAFSKPSGNIVISGGTYTESSPNLGPGPDDVTVTILGGYFVNSFCCGGPGTNSSVTSYIYGIHAGSNIYGGGRGACEASDLNLLGDNIYVKSITFAGPYISVPANELTNVGAVNMHITGGTYAHCIAGSTRVLAAEGSGAVETGITNVVITGGTFIYAGTSSDPGTTIYMGSYVYGNNSSFPTEYISKTTEAHLVIDGDVVLSPGAVCAGAYTSQYGFSYVGTSRIDLLGGTVSRVLGGGWAQSNGQADIGHTVITLAGTVSVDYVYGGGGNAGSAKGCYTEHTDIIVKDSAEVYKIYAGGRYAKSTVGSCTIELNGGGSKYIDFISGRNGNGGDYGTVSEVILCLQGPNKIFTVRGLDYIDKLTIHTDNTLVVNTLTVPSATAVPVINFQRSDSMEHRDGWTAVKGIDLVGNTTAKFQVDGVDTGITWNHDMKSMLLDDNKGTILLSGSTAAQGSSVSYANCDELEIPLTFTAEEAGATVALNVYGTCTIPGMHYRMGVSGEWLPYTAGTVLTLANIGDSCQFWSSAETLAINANNSNYAKFVIPKKTTASGNIMSLLNWREDCYDKCFFALFTGAKITKAPLLPATTLAQLCYDYMFSYCALIEPPKLPATVLAYGCYRSMLASCPALTKAPTLPAETLVDQCYSNMLNGCSNLTEIRVGFTEWGDNAATYHFAINVSATGTFYKPSALPEEYGEDRIPNGWTVVNIDEEAVIPLTLTAEEAGATVSLTKESGTPDVSGLHYRLGTSGDWVQYPALDTVIDVPNVGDCVQFWNNKSTFNTSTGMARFVIPKKMAASGNVMSMLNWSETLQPYCFMYLFYAKGVGGVTCTPYMPAKTLVERCYMYMFFHTPNLTKAEFMAETLATASCTGMFQTCWNLKERKVHFTEWHENATNSWALNAPTNTVLYKPRALPKEYHDYNRIKPTWIVINID